MAEAKKAPVPTKTVKKSQPSPALPVPGSAKHKAMVLRGEIKE